MIHPLSQKNTFRLSVSNILFLILTCGFLLPKFNFSGFFVSIPDLVSILLSLGFIINFKLNKKILSIFKYEIVICFLFFFLLIINSLLANADYYSFFYVIRILSYIAACLFMVQNIKTDCTIIANISITIVGIYIFFYCFYIIFNIHDYTIDQILYGYTKIRLKLPFEYSNTTSVPFGYLLSLIFAYIFFDKIVVKKKSKLNLFLLAQILTISRAAVLSTIVLFFFKKNIIKYFLIPLLFFFIAYKTFESGSFDKSSYDRIRFVFISTKIYFENFSNNFFGIGLSPEIIFSKTNYYYFENIFSQSLINGGPLLLLVVISMYITFSYRIFAKKKYIYIPVLIGNFFGGFNLLSTISLPIYFIIIYSIYELND